jgi:site-specific recombinase XerD
MWNSTVRAYKQEQQIQPPKIHLHLVPKKSSTLTGFERYLYARCGLSQQTVENHIGCIRRLWGAIGEHPTARKADNIIMEMRKAGKSASHQANTAIALERYGAFRSVRIKLGRPKQSKLLVHGTLTEAEVARFLAACKTIREKAIFTTMAYSGIRNKELCNLRVVDLEADQQVLRIHGTKTQKDRAVTLPTPALSVLLDYLARADRQPLDLMFLTARRGLPLEPQDLRKLTKTIAKRAGITKRVFPHLFRHSLATNLLGRGSGILAIREQMGHVHLDTTMRYLHSLPGRLQEEFRLHCPVYL